MSAAADAQGHRSKQKGGCGLNNEYLIVHRSVLPECFTRVLAAQELLRTGAVKEVSEAARLAGISRSTFYKYKDYIFTPNENTACKKAVMSMILSHERGVLSRVLNCLSDCGASVLTIMQNPPIAERASVVMSLDITGITNGVDDLLSALGQIEGVERAGLIDID